MIVLVTKSGTSSGLASHFDLLRGHKTWSPHFGPGPWTLFV